MNAPVLLVVPVDTVDHAVAVEALRCTWTERDTYPVPVFTDTASATADPIVTVDAVVDQPDTLVAVPVTLLIVLVAVVAADAVDEAFTTNRNCHVPAADTGKLAVKAPVLLVVPLDTRTHVVAVDALRCTSTARAT